VRRSQKRGPANNRLKAVAGTYMDNDNADSVGLMFSSLLIVDSVGAMMVETKIRLRPVADRTSVTAHLRLVGQSFGFSVF
jgi:hypothetical protein